MNLPLQNGQDIIDFTNQILGNENIDETLGLQMLDVIRGYIEGRRPWQVLKKKDTTVIVNGANTYDNPLTAPADLRRYLGDGTIQLFDGTNYPQIVTEFPFEQMLERKNNAFEFCVDYGSLVFYIMGLIPGAYTVYQWYIYDPGPITLTTGWLRFPKRFYPLLSYELAAMWRLGTDWDDVNARNADDNARRADMVYKTMEIWDSELSLSQVRNIDYDQNVQGRNVRGGNRQFGPRGTFRR